MCSNKQFGFTLIELLITVSLVGILMSLAAPSFRGAMLNAQLSSSYNDMVGALQLARSEAVKRNVPVVVCALGSDNNCGGSWEDGAYVFVDDGATANSLDGGEELLRVLPAMNGGIDITAFGSSSSAGGSTYIQRTLIRFTPSGTSSWRGGGAIQLCDPRGTEQLRAMLINIGGNIQRARPDEDGDIVTQWGDTLDC